MGKVKISSERGLAAMDDETRHYREAIVRAARAAFADRATLAEMDWRDWGNRDSLRRFVALLRTGRAWLDSRTGTVRAAVTGSALDVRAWGYVCAEVLDVAAGSVSGEPRPGEMISGPVSTVPTQAIAVLSFG